MRKLLILRDKWLRGDNKESYLLRESDDRMCCLGFLCLDLGLDVSDIVNTAMPGDIWYGVISPDFPAWLRKEGVYEQGSAKPLVQQIAEVNDSAALSDPEREAKLEELFLQADITVEFQDA